MPISSNLYLWNLFYRDIEGTREEIQFIKK